MRRATMVVAGTVFAFIAAGCASRDVPDAAKMAPYATFHVVSQVDARIVTADTPPTAIAMSVENAIAQTLTAKGYVAAKDAAGADFFVRYTVSESTPPQARESAGQSNINVTAPMEAGSGGDTFSVTLTRSAGGEVLWKPASGSRASLGSLTTGQIASIVRETLEPLPVKVKR